jgi:hypothetical protein
MNTAANVFKITAKTGHKKRLTMNDDKGKKAGKYPKM